MTFCNLITGKCFAKSGKNLKNLKIDQCEEVCIKINIFLLKFENLKKFQITDESLINLFTVNKNILNLSMKRNKALTSTIMLCVLNNLKNLKNLNISGESN